MRLNLLLIILGVALNNLQAQWEPTYIIEHNQVNQGTPVNAACKHNGAIYAAVYELYKTTNNGNSWETIPIPDFVGFISHIASVENRLYIANYNNWYAKSMIWFTQDDGENWTVDTTGMPGSGGANGGAYVIAMHGWKDHLIATFGGADLFYMKAIDQPWELVEELVPIDPGVYANRGDTIFAVKKYSPDFGQTWITPANNGLPSNIAPFATFATPDRVYISGDNLGSNSMLYSDDAGENWSPVNLGQYEGRQVWSIYATGNHIWLSLLNDAIDTPPDVIYSSDGGNTFEEYSMGLPEDPFGTYYIHTFLKNNNYMFAVNNFLDVYRAEIGASGIDEANEISALNIYPNPAKDKIMLDFEHPEEAERIVIHDISGAVVFTTDKLPSTGELNIKKLKPGQYLINAIDGEGLIRIGKIIKE